MPATRCSPSTTYQQVEDLKNAVSYLLTRDDVDPGRLGLACVCLGAGYGLEVAAMDRRVKALALVAGVTTSPTPAWSSSATRGSGTTSTTSTPTWPAPPAPRRTSRCPNRRPPTGTSPSSSYRIRDGRIAEVVNFAADRHAADAFFWSTWQLKPIPDRLQEPQRPPGRAIDQGLAMFLERG
jgi:hypothetical protein